MKEKISTENLKHLMPHRDKMVWVEYVEDYSELSGRVSTQLKADFPYFSQDKLIDSFFLEFLAQGYGYIKAASLLSCNLPSLDIAMIPMISHYEFVRNNLKIGDYVYGELSTIRQLGNLFLVKGRVIDENKFVLSNAEFKIFAKV